MEQYQTQSPVVRCDCVRPEQRRLFFVFLQKTIRGGDLFAARLNPLRDCRNGNTRGIAYMDGPRMSAKSPLMFAVAMIWNVVGVTQ